MGTKCGVSAHLKYRNDAQIVITNMDAVALLFCRFFPKLYLKSFNLDFFNGRQISIFAMIEKIRLDLWHLFFMG